MTGPGVSYVIAESTQTLSLRYPHTHAPGDQLFLGGGSATASMDGLCEHTISLVPPPPDSNEPFLLEIPDLMRHPKYADTGYVRGWPHGRFYAGAPLRTKNGVSIGTVCLLDDKPRYKGLSPEERLQLSSMADIFMSYLETKQADSDVKKGQMMEMELSRFIAEGFLPDEGAEMVERRGGRLWSEKILTERRAKELERKKRVEERRQSFQEGQFAKMVRQETQKLSPRTQAKANLDLEVPGVGDDIISTMTWELNKGQASALSTRSSIETFATCLEASGARTPREETLFIAHTRPRQPGIIQVGEESSQAENDTSLIDTICTLSRPLSLKNLLPDKARRPAMPSRPSGCSSAETTATMATSLQSVECSASHSEHSIPEALREELPEGSHSDTSSEQRRRSNYEKTASVEPHFRKMFSRAATIIRNALEADVVFVDGDLEGFFSPSGETEEIGSPHLENAAWTASHVSSDPSMEAKTRAMRPKAHRQRSGILGYATGGGSSTSRSKSASRMNTVEDLGFDVSELSEAALTQMAEDNPNGKIISSTEQYPGLEDTERPDLEATERILQRFLPGSRSIIIIPLFDHNRKIFAVGFAWTREPTRIFTGDVEGRFVTGVANSIMGEVTRLNILNGRLRTRHRGSYPKANWSAADKAKGEFISSISHELRSPLHGILASAEFLTESQLDFDQRSFLDTIVSCGTTLLDTVNHVLDFQKLNVLPDGSVGSSDAQPGSDAGNKPDLDSIKEEVGSECSYTSSVLVGTALAETDMSNLVQDVAEGVCLGYGFQQFTHSAMAGPASPLIQGQKSQNITVIVDIEPRNGGWCFHANSAAYKRIINNLVGNAFKYNKENGWIRIHLTSTPAPDDKFGNKRSKVGLTVSDSGKGISREFLKTKLFTPFTQENPLSAGAGLGMSIVRQIVTLMGGKIDVKSQVGKGTQITVEAVLVHNEAAKSPETYTLPATDHRLKAQLLSSTLDDPSASGDLSKLAEQLLRESLATYATEYFGMEILPENSTEAPDLIFVNELTDDNKQLLQLRCEHLPKAAIMVVCNRIPPNRPVLFPNNPNIITTFLRKPCGPKKISRALEICLAASISVSTPFQLSMPSTSAKAPLSPDSGIEFTTPTIALPAGLAINPLHPADDFFSIVHASSNQAVTDSLQHIHHFPSQDPAPRKLRAPPPKPNKPTILAVEDNHINMMLLTTYLKKNGFKFDKAVDGLEALEQVKATEHAYDVVLMDLRMLLL